MLDMLRRVKHAGVIGIARWRYRGLYNPDRSDVDPDRHIRAAADWLRRAQDHGGDRGVSYGCKLDGPLLASYPETTGYIIPTFLELADYLGESDFERRAIEMGDWEIDVQLESGAVMGGCVNPDPSPAVFNTGQVLLGWKTLWQLTGEERFLEAAHRASRWLVGAQSPEGNWVEGTSLFADSQSTAYNARVAWALGEFGLATEESSYLEAAIRNAEFAVARQEPNGWFAECCLSDPHQPLVHTLAYTMRGLLELGVASGRDDLVEAARRTADSLLAGTMADGCLPGRWNREFRPAVRWCCLTGAAQSSIVWSKLFERTGEAKYLDTARLVNGFLMRHHDIRSPDDRLRGGVPGSWPVWGAYGRFLILNWATKFLIDALLWQSRIESDTGRPS